MFDELRDLFLSALYHQESEQILVKRWNEEISRLQGVFNRLTDKISLSQLTPVMHGKWIPDDKEITVHCSECGAAEWYINRGNFCPNCGLPMQR